MKKYLLPIRINNRKYIYIDLQDEQANSYFYEIEASGTCVTLLAIPHGGMAKLVSQGSEKEDKTIYSQQLKKEADVEEYRLVLSKKQPSEKADETECIKSEKDGIYTCYNFIHDFRGTQITKNVKVRLEFKEGDTIYSALLNFQLYTADLFYTLSLDFGSEASQLLIHQGESGRKVKLVEESKKHFASGEFKDVRNEQFIQYETDFLYRSVYFSKIKRAGHSFLINTQTIDAALDSMGFILLTTNEKYESYINQPDQYMLIPNIKIALLGQNDLENPINVSLEKDRYANILVAFILLGYGCIDDERRNKELPIGIRIKILVPNIMKCKDAQELVTHVSRRLSGCKFLKDKVRFEVESQSESEASFLGYANEEINERGSIQGRQFLVIDAGKGTLDYSLLEKDKERNRFKTLFQSGFIGSGNAISFAVFDHIIALICGIGNEKKREDMMRNLLIGPGKDIAGILQLFREVERIKCSMCDRSLSHKPVDLQISKLKAEIQNIGDTNKITCSKLSELLKGVTDLGDGYGIIRMMCLRICQNMMKELLAHQGESSFDRIVLSGRAFKFKMLEEVFREAMSFYYKDGEKIPVSVPTEAKEMCLRGTLDTYKEINVNCGLTGIPETVNVNEEDDEYWELKKKRTHRITNYKLDENFVYNGLSINLSDGGYLFINGEVCGEGMGKTFKFFFDGKGFYERTNSGLKELKSRRFLSAGQYELLAESKFPNYKEGDKIPMFKLPKIKLS